MCVCVSVYVCVFVFALCACMSVRLCVCACATCVHACLRVCAACVPVCVHMCALHACVWCVHACACALVRWCAGACGRSASFAVRRCLLRAAGGHVEGHHLQDNTANKQHQTDAPRRLIRLPAPGMQEQVLGPEASGRGGQGVIN